MRGLGIETISNSVLMLDEDIQLIWYMRHGDSLIF
jgi:hypothetical protein